VALGAGAGAAVGAAIAHGDDAFRDESLDTIGVALKPSTSAVIATTSSAFLDAVQKQVPEEDVRTMVANLAGEVSRRLDEGKSMALGILLTEEGLAMKEVAVSEESAEVLGLAITDEAVVAGAALVTADEVDYEVGVATEEGAVVEAGVVTEDRAAIVDYVAMAEAAEETDTEDTEG
jgi:hypothetical protein